MSDASRPAIIRNLSSVYGEPSPYSTKQGAQSERWTENFTSEPYHSTPKSTSATVAMPASMSYPTLVTHHSDPSPLVSHQHPAPGGKKSPLVGAAGGGRGGGGGMGGAGSPARGSTSPSARSSFMNPQRFHSSPASFLQGSPSPKRSYGSELENTTIQKQRRELQLLIRELQDRDRELNEMVASHQKQLLAWEQDRQKLLALETKCSRLETELKNRYEYIKSLKTRLKVMTSQDQSKACAMETMQCQLRQLSEAASGAKQQISETEYENTKLKVTVNSLSERLGQLEAREQELVTAIKLKDKDLGEASSHIFDLSGRLKQLDLAHKEVKEQGQTEKKQVNDLKSQLNDSISEKEKLQADLADHVNRSTEKRIEMGKLMEQVKGLETELQLAGEREKRKDQLVDLQRSKQDRADAELTSLRQAYERQQRELSLLQLNLDSQRERSKTDTSLKASLDNSSFFDSKPTTPVKSRLSTSMSPIGGGSPLVSNAGEGGVAARHSSGGTEELLLEAAQSAQLGISPTSKLHRLLTESRQMVENLEQSTLPPYIANSSPKTDQDKPTGESPAKSASVA